MKKTDLLLLLLCGFFIFACSSGGEDTPDAPDTPDTPAPELKTPIEAGNDLYGIVIDNAGTPVEGVVVSDGFTCVASDENGVYQMARNKDAYHVFYRIPADRPVQMANGAPCFWKKLSKDQQRYDFSIGAKQAVETQFTLFCLADPQTNDATELGRFADESVPDIKKHVTACTPPVYGITLGDIVSNNSKEYVTPTIMPQIARLMRQDQIGMPLFQVMGNHDNATKPKISEGSSTYDLAARRDFEDQFGPCDYSFERGNAHIIGMDNILLSKPEHNPSNYELGFSEDQIEWLRQDLSFVSEDKLIIFCVHAPMYKVLADQQSKVIGMLQEFPNVHIMSGHSHRNLNYTHVAADPEYSIYEHNHGAVCGAHWKSTICAEGTPNGYGVFVINGTDFSNWYYKPTRYDKTFQIRMYRADTRFAYNGIQRFFYHNADQIVANIWNSDEGWTVDVYENGKKTGQMSRFAADDYDVWACGYHAGVLGHTSYTKKTEHLYYYTLKDANAATVEIRATDKFKNTYKQTMFTTNSQSDYPTVANYPQQ